MKKSVVIFLLGVFLVNLFFINNINAFDIVADSCSAAHIQSAIDTVVNEGGGTVYLPECDFEDSNSNGALWTSTSHKINKANVEVELRIRGAGKDKTRIGYADGVVGTPMWRFTGTGFKELSNIYFKGAGQTNSQQAWLVLHGANDAVIYNCETEDFVGSLGTLCGTYNVLFYNNDFGKLLQRIGAGALQYYFYVYGEGIEKGNTIHSPDDWSPNWGGTFYQVFFEDNSFDDSHHPVSTFTAGTAVVRYNTFNIYSDPVRDTSVIDAHSCCYGDCSSDDEPYNWDAINPEIHAQRGGRAYEIYNNIYNWYGSGSHSYMARIRSGSVIFTGNILNGRDSVNRIGQAIQLVCENNNNGPRCTAEYGYPYDGDYIGILGVAAACSGETDGCCDKVHGSYIWGNTLNFVNNELTVYEAPCGSGALIENRDYFFRAPNPAQDGFTYTPYTYPHPLRAEVSQDLIYYVDKNSLGGQCSDSYTKEQAKNQATPWCTIQKAANMLEAGETVLIKQAIYNERVIIQNSGSLNNFITFKTYPGHNVILDGTGNSGWHGVLSIYGKDYIRIEDLEIRNNNIGWGVLVENLGDKESSYIELINLNVHSTTGEQIQIRGSVNNVLIENCIVHDSTGQWSGIDIYQYNGRRPSNVIVRNCTVYNIPGFACIASEQADHLIIEKNKCYNSEMGIDIGSGTRNIIRDNLVHDVGTGIMLSSNTNSEVYNNTVYNIREEALYNYCWSAHGEPHANNKWYNNVIYNAALGIYESFRKKSDIASCPSSGHEYYNNLFYNIGSLNWRTPLYFEGVEDLNFNQNTIYMNSNYNALEFRQTTGSAKNNIISVSQGTPITGVVTINADYNLYHDRQRTSSGPGANSIVGDPLFINHLIGNFYLQDNSPACGSGEYGYDIGAYPCTNPEPPPEHPQQPTGIITLQDMLNSYQDYRQDRISIETFLEILRTWIIFR